MNKLELIVSDREDGASVLELEHGKGIDGIAIETPTDTLYIWLLPWGGIEVRALSSVLTLRPVSGNIVELWSRNDAAPNH